MFVVQSELNGKLQMLKDIIGESISEDVVIHIVTSKIKFLNILKIGLNVNLKVINLNFGMM